MNLYVETEKEKADRIEVVKKHSMSRKQEEEDSDPKVNFCNQFTFTERLMSVEKHSVVS